MTGSIESAGDSIALLVSFADTARKEGLLALEEPSRSIEDPFLKKGINLAVDGTDPEELSEILEAEIHSKKLEDKVAAKFFTDMGGFAPTLGSSGHDRPHPRSATSRTLRRPVRASPPCSWRPLRRRLREHPLLPLANKIKGRRGGGTPHGAAARGHPRHPGGRQPRRRAEVVAHLPPAERDQLPEPGARRHGRRREIEESTRTTNGGS
jgi:hypothetical protein